MVAIDAVRYRVARRYMLRLRQADFQDPGRLAHLASTANMSAHDFRQRFEPLTDREPPPLDFMAGEG
jgi:AraC-like DNA-binding protein